MSNRTFSELIIGEEFFFTPEPKHGMLRQGPWIKTSDKAFMHKRIHTMVGESDPHSLVFT